MRVEGNNIVYSPEDNCKNDSKICNHCIYSNDESIRKGAYSLKLCVPDVGVYREAITCSTCHQKDFTYLDLTTFEMLDIIRISTEPDFVFAMEKLKKENIVEFQLKMSQFKQQNQQNVSQQPTNVPKCPTCGSTNIKKISGTRRWLGVGLFGIASSDVGKTRECNDCGYKW